MQLPPFRSNEVVSLPPVIVNQKEVYHLNIAASIEKIVSLGILVDDGTSTVQAYIIDTLKPVIEKYSCLVDTWSFKLPRMILKYHYERLDKIDMRNKS